MKLGFNTAILPDLSLEQVLDVAAEQGFSCIECCCWPPGKAERRYAGVTHIDVTSLDGDGVKRIHELCASKGVSLSSLGYYPNVLQADRVQADREIEHTRRVIDASAALGVNVVTTFVGRDPSRSVDENWPRFLEVWKPMVSYAEDKGVKIGIENCPMIFTRDEWPGGKNLASTPAIWRRMFADIPSPAFGLNYDPSHFIWQMVDYIAPIYEFKDRLHHVHAKDARIDRDRLDEHGIMGYPNLWHTPKIPGLGEVDWGRYFGALSDAGYDGPVAIEVEDRAFEGSLEKRKESLIIARRHLIQFLAG
ncbi:sugar phosphate isomerase/epimerase family protein [Tautonia sociabilis]|uniref:Sugar phosphate isomerase/epimerase n=1 Tax=Tautonia sociabilis TaxID=2080755 RepID=A0A432MHF0_9BACT|nr:sugar phosphate isomerase/epimerase [Tautonia sociabilis]RUL86480.1 sugar phosphate isomerase/epimerase [Tautonia sociabilis]